MCALNLIYAMFNSYLVRYGIIFHIHDHLSRVAVTHPRADHARFNVTCNYHEEDFNRITRKVSSQARQYTYLN